jgi:5-methylthioadenosine/S-adenosylhomocysteine deaminase
VYGVGTSSEALDLAAKECADANGTFLNKHQSHMATDVRADDERFGRHALVHLGEIGLLDGNCLMVHMNFIRDDEVASIREGGASIAWCPSTSMFWGIGATFRGRHTELRQSGVNVAFGSDSVNSSGRFDVSRQAFIALLTAREKTQDRLVFGPEDALEMCTIDAAKAIGMQDQLGSLEPGKRADIVIRTRSGPEPNPQLDVVKNLVFSSGSKQIDTVIVDGQIVVESGVSALVDPVRVYVTAEAAAERIARRMGIRTTTHWPTVD